MNIPGKRYLVGGAVRDQLLQSPQDTVEMDWLIVGATTEQMLASGFRRIGKDFPVFIHPQVEGEYALARAERKIGRGHRAFEVVTGANITMEEDLKRRDLTINAMAIDDEGKLHDPHDGQHDLNNRVLRHVGPAFVEDPLRCLRVARFAAKLPNFTVAPETMELMNQMADQLQDLPAERVWLEYEKAMNQRVPHRFYEVLVAADLTNPWFQNLHLPDLITLHKQRSVKGHAAIAAIGWIHTSDVATNFVVRIHAPNRIRNLVTNIVRHGQKLSTYPKLSGEALLNLLNEINCFRQGHVFADVVEAVQSLSDSNMQSLVTCCNNLRTIKLESEKEGAEYGQKLRKKRVTQLNNFLRNLTD